MRNKHKYIDTVWEIFSYDVWGNKKDGFEVNNVFRDGTVDLRLKVETANPNTPQAFEYASPTDKQIRDSLSIKPRVVLDTDGDDLTIYVNHGSTSEPLGEMRCVSHKSLSPIREKKKVDPKPSVPIPDIKGQVTFDLLAQRYCSTQESTPDQLRKDLQDKVKQFNPLGFMLLECQQLDSSNLGNVVIVPYGPNNTFKEIPNHPVSPRGLASDMSVVIAWIDVKEVVP